jgi:hypothetical protein
VEAADCVFLAALSLVSSLWYVGRLGFYSDDWGMFAAFQLPPGQSIAAIVRKSFMDRPAQGFYYNLLYRTFGLSPPGYHVVNAAVLACVTALLFVVLRRLRLPRAMAFGAALIYVMLPTYSTDRFWFAAFAAPLSMLFGLISLLADLEAAGRRGVAFTAHRLGAIAALMVSVLLYEIALPFLFLSPLIVRRMKRSRHFLSMTAVNWTLLSAIAIYKVKTSPRLHAPDGVPALVWSIARNLFRPGFRDGDYGLNLRAAFNVHFGDYGFRLPATVWSLHQTHPLPWLPMAALAIGAGVFLYARTIASDFSLRRSLALAVSGAGVFLVGYSMFLTNKAIQITPTGIGSRTSMGAALGAAMVIAGLFSVIAGGFPSRARSSAFAALLGGYAGGGFFVIATLSSFWIDTYAIELNVENDLVRHVGRLPSGTTLLLAGICSYNGPGIVFESDWDLSGALRLHYGDRTLSADVLRPGYYRVTDDGIATILYEGEDDYDFSPSLLLYDARRKTTRALTDKATALEALRGGTVDAQCPPGGEGVGNRVF